MTSLIGRQHGLGSVLLCLGGGSTQGEHDASQLLQATRMKLGKPKLAQLSLTLPETGMGRLT